MPSIGPATVVVTDTKRLQRVGRFNRYWCGAIAVLALTCLGLYRYTGFEVSHRASQLLEFDLLQSSPPPAAPAGGVLQRLSESILNNSACPDSAVPEPAKSESKPVRADDEVPDPTGWKAWALRTAPAQPSPFPAAYVSRLVQAARAEGVRVPDVLRRGRELASSGGDQFGGCPPYHGTVPTLEV